MSCGLCTVKPGDYVSFEVLFTKIVNKHAPLKTKILQANNKPFINKSLRKEVSTRSRLHNIANRTGKPADISKYKKQWNIVKYFKTTKHKKSILKP